MKRTIALLACGLALSAAPALADDWRAEANYPARIVAFTFGSATLDASHPMSFGSWTVSYGQAGPPIFQVVHYNGSAAMTYTSGSRNNSFFGLVCSNAVQGAKNCAFKLTPAAGFGRDFCELGIGSNTHFEIPCPTDVTFQR